MMMNLDDVLKLIAIVGAIGGVWWRLQLQIAACRERIYQLEIKIANEYASYNSLKEVEGRLVNAIERLTKRIDSLLESLRHINANSDSH